MHSGGILSPTVVQEDMVIWGVQCSKPYHEEPRLIMTEPANSLIIMRFPQVTAISSVISAVDVLLCSAASPHLFDWTDNLRVLVNNAGCEKADAENVIDILRGIYPNELTLFLLDGPAYLRGMCGRFSTLEAKVFISGFLQEGSGWKHSIGWPVEFSYRDVQAASANFFNAVYFPALSHCLEGIDCEPMVYIYKHAPNFGKAVFFHWIGSDTAAFLQTKGVERPLATRPDDDITLGAKMVRLAVHDMAVRSIGWDPLAMRMYTEVVMPSVTGSRPELAAEPSIRLDAAARAVFGAVFHPNVDSCIQSSLAIPHMALGNFPACRELKEQYDRSGHVGKAVFKRFARNAMFDSAAVVAYVSESAMTKFENMPVESMTTVLGLSHRPYRFRSSLSKDNDAYDTLAEKLESLTTAEKDAVVVFDPTFTFAIAGDRALSVFLAAMVRDDESAICSEFRSPRAAGDTHGMAHLDMIAGVVYRRVFGKRAQACAVEPKQCFGLHVLQHRSSFAKALVTQHAGDSWASSGLTERYCSGGSGSIGEVGQWV